MLQKNFREKLERNSKFDFKMKTVDFLQIYWKFGWEPRKQ